MLCNTEITKPSLDRKVKKPLMEKRRRARINKSLHDLKDLLLDSLKRDPSQTSKLEKADILEMTVHLLRTRQRQQLTSAILTDPTVLHRFQTGWAECALQVSSYTNAVEGMNPGIKNRLLTHLDGSFRNIQASHHKLRTTSLSIPIRQHAAKKDELDQFAAAAMLGALTGSTMDPLAQFNPTMSPWRLAIKPPKQISQQQSSTVKSKSRNCSLVTTTEETDSESDFEYEDIKSVDELINVENITDNDDDDDDDVFVPIKKVAVWRPW